MATDTQLNELIINKFGSQAAYEAANAAGLIGKGEMSVWPDLGGGGGSSGDGITWPNSLDNALFTRLINQQGFTGR